MARDKIMLMAQAPHVAESVVSFVEARRRVEEHAAKFRPGKSEPVEILKSVGRALAENILADRDFPPFPRATRDGYAVRAADLARLPAKLKLVGQVKAGDSFNETIGQSECVEIMTGAPVPSGADAVVMVEHTSASGNTVEIKRSVAGGENVVPTGSEARAGQVLLSARTRMDYGPVGVAAAVGRKRVEVFRRPSIAILSTGDEIVGVNEKPRAHQIRNSNSFSLAAQVAAAGGEPLQLAISPDEPSRLRALIRQGLGTDLLLLSGGVSMGKYDLVEKVLSEAEFAAEFFFTGALIQPGKPVVFGRAKRPPSSGNVIEKTYFLGLPGNPISTMVTFELFARPLIDGLCGASISGLKVAHARLKGEFKTKTGLTRFLPAILTTSPTSEMSAEVEPVKWQGSGDIVAAARGNCYLIVPPDRDHLKAGEMVAVLLR
jgi:molybdopterin molybdotransferase